MNLYRHDYAEADTLDTFGEVRTIAGVYLARSASKSTADAKAEAERSGYPILITRISGAGLMKRMKVVWPDGTVNRLGLNQ